MKTHEVSSATGTGANAGSAGALGGEQGDAVVVRRVGEEGAEGRAVDEVDIDLGYAAVREAEATALALTPAQRVAIQRLTSGSTVVDAALAAGVGRATLYRWLKEDAAFIAAYNAWQRDVVATARGKLLAMTDLALSALGKALSRGDGRLALQVLERMGIAERPADGETDVEVVKREQALAAREAELERRKAETVVRSEEEQLELALACGPMLAGMGMGGKKKAKRG